MSTVSKRRGLPWLCLLLLALTVRIVIAVLRPPLFDDDQRIYLTLAESLAAGGGYVFDGSAEVKVHPLLPALHASLLYIWHDARAAGMALTISIGALVCLVGGLTISKMLDFASGYAAGLLLALQPHHVLRASCLEPDLLAALLCLWIAALVWRGDLVLAGLVLGLAYLNRPEMFFLLPIVLVIARARGAGWSRMLLCTVAFLAVSSVFIGYLYAESGRLTLTGKVRWHYMLGVHQYRSGNHPLSGTEANRLIEEVPSPWAHLRSNPREFLLAYLYRARLLLERLALQLGYVLIPFALVGSIRMWRTSPSGLALVALPLFLLPIMVVGATFYRHSAIAGVSLIALAAIGLITCLRYLYERNLQDVS